MSLPGKASTLALSVVLIFQLSLMPILLGKIGYGHVQYPSLTKLQVVEVRTFAYHRNNTLSDYHFNEQPLTVGSEGEPIHVGEPIIINSLVKNQNHTEEHFDYITQILNDEGVVVYLNVRKGVAVPLGGQIPIDSASTPIILNEGGLYLVQIFLWKDTDHIPTPLSYGSVMPLVITT